MTILARIARFLFWLLVVSWSMWLLRRILAKLVQNTNSAPEHRAEDSTVPQTTAASRRLVRDPVCGMHVDETLSIPLRENGELLHFCSIACRDAYAGDMKKLAANG
jgi:YHS domain-containing protein